MPAAYRDFSPIAFVDETSAPFLIMQEGDDSVVPVRAFAADGGGAAGGPGRGLLRLVSRIRPRLVGQLDLGGAGDAGLLRAAPAPERRRRTAPSQKRPSLLKKRERPRHAVSAGATNPDLARVRALGHARRCPRGTLPRSLGPFSTDCIVFATDSGSAGRVAPPGGDARGRGAYHRLQRVQAAHRVEVERRPIVQPGQREPEHRGERAPAGRAPRASSQPTTTRSRDRSLIARLPSVRPAAPAAVVVVIPPRHRAAPARPAPARVHGRRACGASFFDARAGALDRPVTAKLAGHIPGQRRGGPADAAEPVGRGSGAVVARRDPLRFRSPPDDPPGTVFTGCPLPRGRPACAGRRPSPTPPQDRRSDRST